MDQINPLRRDATGILWGFREFPGKITLYRAWESVFNLPVPEAEEKGAYHVVVEILGFHADGRPVTKVDFSAKSSVDAMLEPPARHFVGLQDLPADRPRRATAVSVQTDGSVLYHVENDDRGNWIYDTCRLGTDGNVSVLRTGSPCGYRALVSGPDGSVFGNWQSWRDAFPTHASHGSYRLSEEGEIFVCPEFPPPFLLSKP